MADHNARMSDAVRKASEGIRAVVHELLSAAVEQAETEIENALRATRTEAKPRIGAPAAEAAPSRPRRDRRPELLVDRVYKALPEGAGLSLDEICARRPLKGIARNQIGLALSRLEKSGRMKKSEFGLWQKLPTSAEPERQVA